MYRRCRSLKWVSKWGLESRSRGSSSTSARPPSKSAKGAESGSGSIFVQIEIVKTRCHPVGSQGGLISGDQP